MSSRLLSVTVVQATLESEATVACTVKLLDLALREIGKKESFKTKAGKKGKVVDFPEQTFQLGSTYNLSRPDSLPHLQLELVTSTTISSSKKLGQVVIPLDTIDQTTEKQDSVYSITELSDGQALVASLRVILEWSEALQDDTLGPLKAMSSAEEIIEEDPKFEDELPNELHVSILKAKDLLVMDSALMGKGSSDPRVVVTVGGVKKKTEVIHKNLNPIWNEKFVFEITDLESAVQIVVEDEDFGGVSADFMGKVVVPLLQLQSKKPMRAWKRLGNKAAKSDSTKRGEIEVLLHWKYNPQAKRRKQSSFGFMNSFGLNAEESDEEADYDPASLEATPKTEEEIRKEQEEKAEAKKKQMEEIGDIQIKSGDYQIQVHIIEVRDLKAEDTTGTSDPVCYVEAFGEKQNTPVKEKCLSAVFDERFIFNYRDMDKDTFDAGQIRVNVMDADFGKRNDMIGSFVVDASLIYFRPKHEFYREWVALVDDTSLDDTGVQGYLKLSISVIGPGDKMVTHDEEDDKAREKKREEEEGIKASIPPTVKRKTVWLVTTIFRAEYLPVMDSGAFTTAGIDAFFQVDCGTAMKRTRKNKCLGERASLNPIWNSELWIPVTLPIMSDIVRYTVWDWDRMGNELVSTATEKFNQLNRDENKKTPPHWKNLYGAQMRGYPPALNKNPEKLHYNKYPGNAPHYRGRILVSERIVEEAQAPPNGDGSAREITPFRLKLKQGIKQSQQPAQETYKFRAMIISGTEIPIFKRGLHTRKMQIKIQCGRNEIYSKRVENKNGVCEWNEMIESEAFIYPKDIDQCPDIVVSICKGKDVDTIPIAYRRYKFRDIVESNFAADAGWILFEEDKALNMLEDGQFPGSALIRLGAGLADDADRTHQEWDAALSASYRKTAYQLRCHIYQARSLPASDANGLMDPYFKLNFNGQQFEAKNAKKCKNGRRDYQVPKMLRKKTCDPLWYGTVCFDTELPEPQFFPQVNFQLFDWDGYTGFDKDDYNGCFNAALTEDNISDAEDSSALKPQWYSLMREEEGDSEGEVLACFQLIKKRAPEVSLTDPPSIKPPLQKAFIEIVAIGCRDLSPFNMLNMQFPKVEFSVDSDEGTIVESTDKSKRPSGSNPNYLQRIVMEVQLPIDPIFAPPITVKLYDYRLAGLSQPICGVSKIDMSKKLPWAEGYINPALAGRRKDAREASTGVAVEKVVKKKKKVNGRYVIEEEVQMAPEEVQGDLISPVAPLLPKEIKSAIEEKLEAPDTGAGVFGALKHIKAPPPKEAIENKGKKRSSVVDNGGVGQVLGQGELTDEEMLKLIEEHEMEDDQTQRYMLGREKLPGELEELFPTSPFENFSLFRGQGSLKKEIGIFKGLIRVVRDEKELEIKKEGSNHGGIDMTELLKPKQYTVRLYVLRGLSLAPMDIGFMGRPGKSDPYLKVNVGDDKFNDKKNYVSDVTEVDFYKCIELHTELPGAGQLEIEVMDYDAFGSDDLIGKTVIDLEDRWFDDRWKKLGSENYNKQDGKMRWNTKPLERRSLFTDTKNTEQGQIECYVDIMPTPVAEMFPPDDVALPPKQTFEVRLIVWRAKEMISMDVMEDMNDLYFVGWVEGSKKQSTDIHWRARNGKGSFNWRMKFDVELGHNTQAMKFPYLHLQAWDKDLLKFSDCIAESFIDLGNNFKRAYKKNQTIEVYKKRNLKRELESIRYAKAQEEKRKKKEEEKRRAEEAKQEEERMIAAVNAAEPDLEMGVGGHNGSISSLGGDSMGLEEDGVQLVERGAQKSDENTPLKSKAKAKVKNKKSAIGDVTERASSFANSFSNKEMKRRANEDYKRKKEIAKEKHKRSAQADKDELENLLGSMKELCGVGEDPPNSTWVKLMRKDFETGEDEEVGQVAISVSIIPKNLAESNPAGFGRKEPNNDPYLPNPSGRLKFTLNPFSMGTQLFGPAICAKVACFCCCIFIVLLTYFIAPYLNIIISLSKD
ncbi:hypothetical protein TrVE_jg577 [Triparma verrucosa]|uniref:C2 domain-containing protein n=1 Tax=Triparma verrucosa TaxID=1606542 RepID=A0A9W7C8R5_9STRA|nr:hypothetical protein TrVE_jg577 [Triparma verrucosa]